MPATKNVDVAWDNFASVRHDENAFDIAEAYGLAAADVYLDDIEGLEETLTRHPEIGRLYDPARHAQRRVHTSSRRWSLVYDYDPAKNLVVILDVMR
jgi:plasmid stabilization system protein ParE